MAIGILSLGLMLAGCGAPPQPATQPLPSPIPPTPTLRPAPAYIEGQALIPEGMILFVEYFVVNDGSSSTGECPDAAMIDFPGYSFSEGVLDGIGEPSDETLGFAGFGTANSGAMGGGVSSGLYPITAFPFSLPYSVAVVHAVLEGGAVVVEIQRSSYLLSPGESWVQRAEWDRSPDCHRTDVSRFTNFGLLHEAQVEIR